MQMSQTSNVHFLSRPEGRIAYTVDGDGPLVVAVPGMGDIRSTWRDVVPALVGAGFRVAVMDLPGHGDSDATFSRFDDVAVGEHALALTAELGGRAVLMGNSMGASAAVWAAAQHPDAVAGLVLSAPFLRDSSNAATRSAMGLLYRALLAGPWGAGLWRSLYRGSFAKGAKPAWFDEHVADVTAALRRPGRLRSLRRLAVQLDHSVVEEVVDDVRAPALIVVGALDPDYSDPAAELAVMRDTLHARAVLVDGVGHYPHFQASSLFVSELLQFVGGLRDGEAWTRA
jgi:pimeloyl-ACP methyl ester carboxylesterase